MYDYLALLGEQGWPGGSADITAAGFRKRLHEGLQALGDVVLAQWKRSVGLLTLLGSLVLLAAHRTQHGSVQELELLLRVEQAQPFTTDHKHSTTATTAR